MKRRALSITFRTIFLNAFVPSRTASFMLHIDDAIQLSSGGALPPMTEVPCSGGPIKSMVKPPNVDTLYDWYESRNMADSDPSWGVLWPTAVSLSNHLIENPSIVDQKRVVELGSGLSLCGLTAAALNAKSVLISDREPYALHCALATASLNNLDDSVKAAVVDWADTTAMVNAADVVIASDVLYDKETIEAFGNACKQIISSPGGIVLVTDPAEERIPRAREMLREALGDDVRMTVSDLPLPNISLSSQTPDAKDHGNRMKEPTVLIELRL